jgi:predicted dehydrogenase
VSRRIRAFVAPSTQASTMNATAARTRRQFLAASAAALSTPAFLRAADAPKLKAAIIGHTGRGDYGHGLDVIFNGRPNIELVAVADAHAEGLAKMAAKLKAPRQYADYRAMLEKERPQLVAIGPRHADQHLAMGLAAVSVGAHIYMEKPITPTLAEADELLAAADKRGAKFAVAHQMRMAPNVVHLRKRISDGLIGELLEMRSWGKQDARAGGEDMIVLGSHLFDLMRLFAGDAQWCGARVTQAGRDITPTDARVMKDNVGPVAGDEVTAQFGFAKGVTATFTSRAKLREHTGHWGIEFIGTKGAARILANIPPQVFALKSSGWKPDGKADEWRRLPDDPTLNQPAAGFTEANARLVDDWLDAIAKNRAPECSGHNAMKAIEMLMAVYQSALGAKRVSLPLNNRRHPLAA